MLIAHADWSLHPGKRWLAVARETENGWDADAPVPVGNLADLLSRLRSDAEWEPVLFGIDTPLGLPIAYAERAGITSFRDFLANDLGSGDWAHFATVASHLSNISLFQPFYPHAPGQKKLIHLIEGLGLTHAWQLRRACELASAKQPGILFWTLGANQTGKAALRAWTELIRPALANDRTVKLWPFDGDLADLAAPGQTVIAETYPAAAASLLEITIPPPGKTSQVARMAAGVAIHRVCDQHAIRRSPDLNRQIDHGFSPRKDGEDPFDALLGLLGMIAVADDFNLVGIAGATLPSHVRTVEGWILGVSVPPA